MLQAALELQNVTKKFDGLMAVKNLSLHVHPGEIYGLIGPNGSGKTTTIKMVAGLYRPTKGMIRAAGFDVVESPTKAKKSLGYVPDDPSAYDRLTGREFLEFVGELYGMDRAASAGRINVLLDAYGIRAMAETGLYQSYSRGTKQKIAMAAGLMHDPAVLLIDEPMVGLDPESAGVTKHLLRDFVHRGGAIFLSTHTMSVGQELCHRFGLLKEGEIIADGRLAALRRDADLPAGSLEECYLKLVGRV